ncbi:MAG TPA: TlpA disulfide reductase family protein [Pirellulales bacterium]|nr:TlpA disulfide reductase family protein [Pirellulales bacterium]
MKSWRHGLLVLFVFLFCSASLHADEPQPKNYVLFPITTGLQRSLAMSTNADAYAQFDVAEVMQDGAFDPRRFDEKTFLNDLTMLVQKLGIAKPSLQIFFRYAGVALDPNDRKAMESAVTGVCRQAGFAKVRTGMAGEGGSWKEKVARFANVMDNEGATETPVETEFVRVYPVQTKLSRFLLGNTDYDCLIELRQPIDGRFTAFSEASRHAISQQVATLKLPHKRNISFRCFVTTAGRDSAERYFARRNGSPAPADAFIKELGFQACTYRMTPMSVSPEDLLNKQAPDFTLDALDGGEIHLHDLIRGRVGVVSFWGVACGACRVEAPHLTALHDRFKDEGLVVIAVNGYDESKVEVEKYVRDKGLSHPIALMGSKVAGKQYTVASYPVTFLIDRKGVLVDYHLGFEPGDEKLLAASIERLLAVPANGDK